MMETELINLFLKSKSVAIFGTGSGAIKVISKIMPLMDKVVYFIDNNISKTEFCGKAVFHPSSVDYFQLDLIVVASSYSEEIINQLKKLNKNEDLKLFSPFEATKQFEIKVGKYTYGLNQNTATYPKQIKEIGAFCSINYTASIGSMNHPTDLVSTHPFLYLKNRGFTKQDIKKYVLTSVALK